MGDRIYTLFHAVTPSDTNPPAPFPVNGLYVATANDVVIEDNRGVVTTFVAVPAGTVLPVAPQKVRAATTADVVALGDKPVGSF